MTSTANPPHRALLEAAVAGSYPCTQTLKNAAIYVTGASGFLAASLLAFLHELNCHHHLNLRLYASARRPVTNVPLFGYLGLNSSLHGEVEWEIAPVEVAQVPSVENLIVVHTASYGSPRDYLKWPVETFEANTQSMIRLWRQCPADRVRQFVYFSSAEVYGQPPDAAIPTTESYRGGLDTLAVRSIYGESKRMGEVLGCSLAQQRNTPFTIIRPWNVYGPGQRITDGRVPIEFIRQAGQDGVIRLASNGTPRRAFCFVWDAIAQIVATLGQTAPVLAFNVGNSNEEVSILELARQCAEACGLPADVVSCDPAAKVDGLQRCVPDIHAILQLTGKTFAFIPLSTGLRILHDWEQFLSRTPAT